VIVLCQGGNFDAFEILPIITADDVTPPALEEGDTAIYTKDGGFVICRNNGTVELFGKNNGGIIKVQELQAQLAKNNQILTALLGIIRGAPIPESGGGAPSSFQAGLAAASGALQIGDFSNIASDKVFHGTGAST